MITINVGQVILDGPWLFDKNITIYSQSTCVNLIEGKQIKLLPLRLKTGQPKQIFTLTLLPTPSSPPLIATAPSLYLTSHAYHVRKLLPPLLLTPSYNRVFESVSAFASHKHVHKLYKKINDGNKQSNAKLTL